MGEAFSKLLNRVTPMEEWAKKQCGPTLRKLFGGYYNPDYWSVYRRFRSIDDGDGYINYDELLQVICMQEFNLLFLWDNFSQQNELVPALELMTVISVFSSASLVEKGKFLMSVFDESHTGLNTGAEIAKLMFSVLSVLAKCTGERIKQREVTDKLKGLLPELLPTYAQELAQKYGSKHDAAFQNARIIGQIELEKLLPAIQSTYEALPISGPPPEGCCLPPPPEWAETVGERRPAVKSKPPTAEVTQSAAKLSQAEIAHLEWMSGLLEEDDMEGKENLSSNAAPQQTHERERVMEASATGDDMLKGAEQESWMCIYGSDFSTVARDLTSFRVLFIRSIAQSLGLPQGCVEVQNVARGPGRSVVVAFLVRPGRNGDTRTGADLVALLEQQLMLSHSALRRSAFKEYCASAEIFDSAPNPQNWPPQPMEATMREPAQATPIAASSARLAGTLAEEPDPGPDPTELLSEMLAEAKSECEAMRRERDELRRQLQASGGNLNPQAPGNAQQELEELRKRAEDAESEIEGMRERAEAAEKERDSLMSYIEALGAQPPGDGAEALGAQPLGDGEKMLQ